MSTEKTENPEPSPGRRVALARNLKGWSQAQLAERLDVSAASVQAFETSEDHKVSTCRRYAAALGVPVSWLVDPSVPAPGWIARHVGGQP